MGDVEMMDQNRRKIHKAKPAVVSDTHGALYTVLWARAGGDIDEYVNETAPSLALVSALLLTITMEGALGPPDQLSGDEATAYVIIMELATALNLMIIILSLAYLNNFHSCSDMESKLHYGGRYGYVVPLATMCMGLTVLLVFGAIFIAMHEIGGVNTLYIVALPTLLAYFYCGYVTYSFTAWNRKNYGPSVEALEKRVFHGNEGPPGAGPLPDLHEVLGNACKALTAAEANTNLEKHGLFGTQDLLDFMVENALKEDEIPGLGRFSKALERVDIRAGDALRISAELEEWLEEEEWVKVFPSWKETIAHWDPANKK